MGEAMRFEEKDLVRFAAKVLLPEDPDDCWIWVGARHGQGRGYGKFRLGGRLMSAHRASYLLFDGPIEDGLVVNHVCVNESCVNPRHLITCTQSENVLYSMACGTHNHFGRKE